MPNKISEARQRANKKWEVNNCKRTSILLPLDLFADFEKTAEQLQLSKNAAIKQAIIEYIERHKPIN